MRSPVAIALPMLMLAIAAPIASPGLARAGTPAAMPPARGPDQLAVASPRHKRETCTRDGLIHAEASPAITARVEDVVRLADKSSRIRDVARLTLPCGFRLDRRSGWNLVLTDGKELRAYLENNPFGFMPAFGFSGPAERSFTLRSQKLNAATLRDLNCTDGLARFAARLQLCTNFGSTTALFGVARQPGKAELVHYVVQGGELKRDFKVADIDAKVEIIFFMPPPDAPGGTITLILRNRGALYRAFVDVSRG
jgi:hypothetical protein